MPQPTHLVAAAINWIAIPPLTFDHQLVAIRFTPNKKGRQKNGAPTVTFKVFDKSTEANPPNFQRDLYHHHHHHHRHRHRHRFRHRRSHHPDFLPVSHLRRRRQLLLPHSQELGSFLSRFFLFLSSFFSICLASFDSFASSCSSFATSAALAPADFASTSFFLQCSDVLIPWNLDRCGIHRPVRCYTGIFWCFGDLALSRHFCL